MPLGEEKPVGRSYSVKVPEGVIFPILLDVFSVNQRFPSGPVVIPVGPLKPVGIGKKCNHP